MAKHQPLTVPPSATVARAANLDAARAALATSALSVKNPVTDTPQLAPVGFNNPVLYVHVMDVDCYEKNPRTQSNDKEAEIEQSIRVGGITSPIQVTQIPDRKGYVCARGANTRLRIVQKLWNATKDPKYERLLVQVVPWEGHATAIVEHLKENILRADMTFWDKAKGCASVREETFLETGEVPSARAFTKLLVEKYGFSIDVATFTRYLHCVEHLEPIKNHLSSDITKQLIPASNALFRLALKFEQTEAEAWMDLDAAVGRYGQDVEVGAQTFSAQACIEQMRVAMAAALQLTVHQLQFALTTLEHNDKASKADLLTTPEPPDLKLLQRLPGGSSSEDDDSASQNDQQATLEGTSGGGVGQGASKPPAPQNPLQGSAQGTVATPPNRDHESPSDPLVISGQNVSKPSVPRGIVDIDTALDAVIDAASSFCDVCHIGEWLETGRSLPYGYYMELRNYEVEGIPGLRETTAQLPDARVRVAAWWMAAGVSRQSEPTEVVLLPAHSPWRQAWSRENERPLDPDTPNLYDIIQETMGGVITDLGDAALHIEYIAACMADPLRLAAWNTLCEAINALHAARNRVPVAIASTGTSNTGVTKS